VDVSPIEAIKFKTSINMSTKNEVANGANMDEVNLLKADNRRQEDEITALKAQLLEAERNAKSSGHDERGGLDDAIVTENLVLRELLGTLHETLLYIDKKNLNELHFTTAMRMRLFGAGERRWGMIEKTYDLARENPGYFTEPLSSYDGMGRLILNVELWRDVDDIAERIARLAKDHYLVTSNAVYAMARIFYRNVQTAAAAGDLTAQGLFNELRTYYAQMGRRRNAGAEPTIEQLVKDVKALAHGRKDGEIVVKNMKPHEEGGKHLVVDDIHKPAGTFKETIHGTICPQCGCENEHDAMFCKKCGQKF
jgi:hypothetical protein